MENAEKTISMVLTIHFFCTRPPYRTASAGILIIPTKVADTSCHALSPELSQLGYGINVVAKSTATPFHVVGKRAALTSLDEHSVSDDYCQIVSKVFLAC
jgi:hypothetical protein